MKKFYLYVLSVIFYHCSAPNYPNDAVIRIEENKYNFGEIQFNKEAAHSFQFRNDGETLLTIYTIKTSCGCTAVEWSKKPVSPGKGGNIKIKYDASFPGVFHKNIEVYYNGKQSPLKIEVEGEVKGIRE